MNINIDGMTYDDHGIRKLVADLTLHLQAARKERDETIDELTAARTDLGRQMELNGTLSSILNDYRDGAKTLQEQIVGALRERDEATKRAADFATMVASLQGYQTRVRETDGLDLEDRQRGARGRRRDDNAVASRAMTPQR